MIEKIFYAITNDNAGSPVKLGPFLLERTCDELVGTTAKALDSDENFLRLELGLSKDGYPTIEDIYVYDARDISHWKNMFEAVRRNEVNDSDAVVETEEGYRIGHRTFFSKDMAELWHEHYFLTKQEEVKKKGQHAVS